VYYFEAAGLILLVAMVGAIVLTLHRREGVKRQNPVEQNARTKLDAIELRKVPSRQGV
jgi:NADH-quinone oxidoreductase subunit J